MISQKIWSDKKKKKRNKKEPDLSYSSFTWRYAILFVIQRIIINIRESLLNSRCNKEDKTEDW